MRYHKVCNWWLSWVGSRSDIVIDENGFVDIENNDDGEPIWDPKRKAFVMQTYDTYDYDEYEEYGKKKLFIHDKDPSAKRNGLLEKDALGFWILNHETCIYERQYVGEDISDIIFETSGSYMPKFYRCRNNGIVGKDVLEFDEVDLFNDHDLGLILNDIHRIDRKRTKSIKKQFASLKKELNASKKLVENLQSKIVHLECAPGGHEMLKAKHSFEELAIGL